MSAPLRREAELPSRLQSQSASWIRRNRFSLAALLVALIGLFAFFGRQVANSDLAGTPPWKMSLPLATWVAVLISLALVRKERSWRLLGAAILATITAIFLGWFLVALFTIALIYVGLQLVG